MQILSTLITADGGTVTVSGHELLTGEENLRLMGEQAQRGRHVQSPAVAA